jgi:hypothetical protein
MEASALLGYLGAGLTSCVLVAIGAIRAWEFAKDLLS